MQKLYFYIHLNYYNALMKFLIHLFVYIYLDYQIIYHNNTQTLTTTITRKIAPKRCALFDTDVRTMFWLKQHQGLFVSGHPPRGRGARRRGQGARKGGILLRTPHHTHEAEATFAFLPVAWIAGIT